MTLLHPRGESFWWLAVEPPLLVVLVGVLFAVFVARPLIADLEEPMQPHAEMVHWLFGAGILFVGLCLLCEAIVGTEVWRRRRWRAYLWPSVAFGLGVAALAGDGALHELGDPHVRARVVGGGR